MGYGYQERELDKSVIDWSGLTKTISDNLVKEAKRRETLKFELEKTQQEELQKLNEYEQGLDSSANKWAMDMAQQAREFKMQNHKLMKAGLRSVNDSKLVSQNVMDGWTNLNGALKSYNETYKKLNEKGGKGNQFILQEMANFVDLKNKKIYYDPNTGSPYFANVDPKTGKMDENSLRPVRSFNNVQAQEFEVIDVEVETTKLAKNTAAWELAISSTRDLENARLNPTYQQWRDNSVKSILSSDQRTASVLMDYLNLDPTSDSNAPSGTVTYQRVKGYDKQGKPIMETVTKNIGQVQMEYVNGVLTPKLTEEQKELAKDAVVSSLENKLAFKTAQQYVAPIDTDKLNRIPTVSDANVQLIEVSKGNERDLKSAVQTAAKEVGISVGRITVLDGEILLDGNIIGKVGDSTAPEIAQQLEQAAQTTTTQKKSTITKGNVR
jgi:hypothetical protein